MGYMRHHAVLVTSFDEKKITAAHERAVELCGPLVSGIVDSVVNGYRSFFVAPDGSKEGWPPSDEGDRARARFCQWLAMGDSWCEWALVQYGDDEGKNEVLLSSGRTD